MSENEKVLKMLDKHVREIGAKRAMLIEGKLALVIKQKPRYCPRWLYNKIIYDSVELIQFS